MNGDIQIFVSQSILRRWQTLSGEDRTDRCTAVLVCGVMSDLRELESQTWKCVYIAKTGHCDKTNSFCFIVNAFTFWTRHAFPVPLSFNLHYLDGLPIHKRTTIVQWSFSVWFHLHVLQFQIAAPIFCCAPT